MSVPASSDAKKVASSADALGFKYVSNDLNSLSRPSGNKVRTLNPREVLMLSASLDDNMFTSAPSTKNFTSPPTGSVHSYP
jgi:hypothetical protein